MTRVQAVDAGFCGPSVASRRLANLAQSCKELRFLVATIGYPLLARTAFFVKRELDFLDDASDPYETDDEAAHQIAVLDFHFYDTDDFEDFRYNIFYGYEDFYLDRPGRKISRSATRALCMS